MPTAYYSRIPLRLKQTFTRIRRTSAVTQDSFGDATFTENQTAGFRGFVQYSTGPGETVIVAGKETPYDAVVYTSGTFLVGETDILLLASSTATALSTRYHVRAIRRIYDGYSTVDHTQVFVSKEIT